MTDDRGRPVESSRTASKGSSTDQDNRTGTVRQIPAPRFESCPCPEAELLRDILAGRVPATIDTPSWSALLYLVEVAAVHKLRQLSHDLAGAADWSAWSRHAPHTELQRRRDHYDRPPRTPAQIDAEVRHSWAQYMKGAA